MDWLQITQALFLAAMMVFIFPMVKRSFNKPGESSGKWGSIVMPLIIVIAIVALLISFVQ
ncbi:MAG: hypothetical protein COA83_00745 [Methylophaga sp.]|nr:MAG: hypothetical protein COA83_00745 [Methylophaga sp.]